MDTDSAVLQHFAWEWLVSNISWKLGTGDTNFPVSLNLPASLQCCDILD